MEKNLSEKTVLVTGASGGIGKAIAFALAKVGCRLVLCCNKNREALSEFETPGSRVFVYQGDLSLEENVADLFAQLEKQNMLPDCVVNNAGISKIGLMQDLSASDWDEIFAVNVKSYFLVSKYALSHMIHEQDGAIVNISSMWGEVGASCEVAYSSSKGAVISFTKALAKEVGPSNIRVNCITPGVIDTPMNAHLSEEDIKALEEETPLGKIGKPEDVANAVLFLLSDKASFITGQVLGVNGGFVI